MEAHRVHAHKLIGVEPGKKYQLSIHVRGEGEVALGAYECDEHQRFLVTAQDPEPAAVPGAWKRLYWTFTPQKDETSRARFFVWVKGNVFLWISLSRRSYLKNAFAAKCSTICTSAAKFAE